MLHAVAGVLLMATCAGSVLAYFAPPPRDTRHPGISAWQQTHAARCWGVLRLWGLSRDEARRRTSSGWMGGDVFAFTQLWGRFLDERLMPQTKCWDHTRAEHIAYLLPNTGRRPIPPPPGEDTRPPVVVGYSLRPEQLRPSAIMPLTPTEPAGTLALTAGRRLGQSFITQLDYDMINAMGLLAPGDAPLPRNGYRAVIYHHTNGERVLGETTTTSTRKEQGMQVLELLFEPPLRLPYSRGSTPYLLEVTWERPANYNGPAPELATFDGRIVPVGELFIDGQRQPDKDLGFVALATHTDVEGYTRVLPLAGPEEAAWPPYFFAVRKDVIQLLPPSNGKQTLAEFFKQLNTVLLEL